MEFKSWLEQQMSERKLGQAELARLSRVPQPTIQRILSGETSDPRGSTIGKIERALGLKQDLRSGISTGLPTAQQSPYISNIAEKIDLQAEAIKLLASMDQDDAHLWIETIRAVSNKTRRENQQKERDRIRAIKPADDPPLDERRTA